MDHSFILWIATFTYAFHVVEEYMFDWKSWACNTFKLSVDWSHFAVVNGAVIILGISCSAVAWALPAYALCLPALMLINATFFHVLPFLLSKGKFSPGLITAVLLFYPIALWAFYGARLDGVLSLSSLVLSFIIGALLMASPIVMLKLRSRPCFQQ